MQSSALTASPANEGPLRDLDAAAARIQAQAEARRERLTVPGEPAVLSGLAREYRCMNMSMRRCRDKSAGVRMGGSGARGRGRLGAPVRGGRIGQNRSAADGREGAVHPPLARG